LVTGGERAVASKASAERDLRELLEELNQTAKPFSESYPVLKRVLSEFLFCMPSHPIGWLIRLAFFGWIAIIVSALFDSLSGDSDYEWWDWLLATTFLVLINLWGRAADRIKGSIVKRGWWRRALLIYNPLSKKGALFQVAFGVTSYSS
jgi:hypothetical protein